MPLPRNKRLSLKELSCLAPNLPIHECLREITQALEDNDTAILEAPPGAGKTSIVPLALIQSSWIQGQSIIMLQPRRVAARAAARRMATLLNEKVGETVGYHIRSEKKFCANTRIIVMTEGILTRRLQHDPELNGIGCVIFDEFHERSLDADVGLAYTLFTRELMREDNHPLKLLVMSATLEGLPLHDYLNNPPLIKSEGASFPVDIQYQNKPVHEKEFINQIEHAIKTTILSTNGDILVFLPGAGEIRKLQEILENSINKEIKISPLHGSLSAEQQNEALEANHDSQVQKIILATDIAETSVTIEGITTVIDSGFSRGPIYDPKTGLTRLSTRRISKASATQRAGRAGRTGPGTCIRLWSKSQHENLVAHYPAEILTADLCPLSLQLLAWGVSNIDELQWLDKPPKANYQQGIELLETMGAIKTGDDTTQQTHHPLKNYKITKLGERMSELPVHPRLARMLALAQEYELTELACDIAALLSERDPLQKQCSDIAIRLDIIRNISDCPKPLTSWKKRIQQQSRALSRLSKAPNNKTTYTSSELAILLAAAYPDRIARCVDSEKAKYKIANGRMATLPSHDPNRKHEWLVAIELGGYEGRSEDRIFLSSALEASLFQKELRSCVKQIKHSYWDKSLGKFISKQSECIGEIELSSTPTPIDTEARSSAICRHIQCEGLALLNWCSEIQQWQARIILARHHFGEDWPDVSDTYLLDHIEEWLKPFLQNTSNIDDLKNLDIKNILSSTLSWEQQQSLNEIVPTHLTAPSGSRIQIDYTQSPPVLAVKLQEMFGCTKNPSVANGKQALSVHLLSPARRPIQITQDLAGFWKNSYDSVKKDMKGRYPKHPWPDDPTTAIATAATKKGSSLISGETA